MGKKKKEFVISEDDLCYVEPIEEIFIEDYVPPINENTVAVFNFSKDADATESFDKRNEVIDEKPKVIEHVCTPYPLSPTPEINGEQLDTRRSYNLRKSTIQKLNILKSDCPQCNLYISTIVDDAINFYFDYIKKS